MIRILNLLTNEIYYGDELEFFIDEDTAIGEVYLDGDLIYQSVDTDVSDEDELELEFSRTHEISYETEDIDTLGSDWNDDFFD